MLLKYKGYFLVLGTAFISGFSIFINKFGVSVVNPNIFTFLKNSIVAIFLVALFFIFKDFKLIKNLSKKQWGLLLVIGLIGGCIPFLLFFKGLSLTNAAGTSFIQKTMFVWIFILAGVFLKEKITRNYILAGILLIAGNLFLLKLSAIDFNSGSLLVFIATLFWAIENVISKYALKDIESRIVMWGRMFFGSIFILIYLFYSQQIQLLGTLNLQQIGWSMLTGIILLAYVFTWYTGLKYIKVSEAAIILMLGSPVTTFLTAIFAGSIKMQDFLSSIIIIFGVIIALGIKTVFQKTQQIYVHS